MDNLKLFGLIGESLKHSFSERYFKEKFLREGLENCDYRNFELNSIEEFPELVKLFPKLRAVNITMPYKEQILKYIDVLDEEAEKVGSVNVVTIKKYDKKTIVKGYNTDIYGVEVTLLHSLKNKNVKALILGTGGAAKAVKYVLDKLSIENNFVSRKSQKDAKFLYQDVSQRVISEHKLIINTTPLGMFPKVNFCPDLNYQFLSKEHLLIDLIYNPPLTKFLQKGKDMGATVINGEEMLISQAEKSWEIFCSM